jgi:hypothetical protein
MPKKGKKVRKARRPAKRLSLKKQKVSAGSPKVLKRDRECKRKVKRQIAREIKREVKREVPKRENEPE